MVGLFFPVEVQDGDYPRDDAAGVAFVAFEPAVFFGQDEEQVGGVGLQVFGYAFGHIGLSYECDGRVKGTENAFPGLKFRYELLGAGVAIDQDVEGDVTGENALLRASSIGLALTMPVWMSSWSQAIRTMRMLWKVEFSGTINRG